MKTKIIFLSAIPLLFFIMAACDGQTSRTDTREDLAEIREDLQEVIQNIDEALAKNDISDFTNKTDDAVSSLDNTIDDYLNEMDNAERRIDQNTRNQIIEMKQKKIEIEFKLALLEQDDYDDWGDNDSDSRQEQAGTMTDTRRGDDPTATATTGSRQTTSNDRNRRTDRRQILYGQQLVDDLKNDLRDLRGKVEQFSQSLPRETSN